MEKQMKKYKHSLGKKILMSCALFSIFFGLVLGVFGAVIYYQGMMDRYEEYMEGILEYSLTEINADDLELCLETGQRSESFNMTQEELNRIKENYEIEYIYIVKPLNTNQTDNMMNIMAGSTAEEREYESNTLVSLGEYTGDAYSPDVAENYLNVMNEADANEVSYFSNTTEFGHDYTGIVPIINSSGEKIAVLAVDISIEEIVNVLTKYIISILIGIIVLVAVLLLGMYKWLSLRVITPIFKIHNSAQSFVQSSHGEKNPENIQFTDPEIKSDDEMQELSESLVTMAKDLKEYMKDLMRETQEKERIGAELNVATNIQASMLPCIFPAFPNRDEVDIYATMNPAKEVGGDFYDFFMIDDRHLVIVMADVSGKGVPAALFMVIGKTLIKDHTQKGRDLGEVFTEVNNILCETNDNGMFITAFEGVLDLVTGEFRYVNAGHERPFIYHKANGAYEEYKTRPGFVLAGMENIKYKEQKIQLEPGDKIFQYTDGVTEATGAEEKLYGMKRLGEVLNAKCTDLNPEATLKTVKADIDEFVGENDQFDDITMLCLEYRKRMEV